MSEHRRTEVAPGRISNPGLARPRHARDQHEQPRRAGPNGDRRSFRSPPRNRDDLHHLQRRVLGPPQVGELFRWPEPAGKVEGTRSLVAFVTLGGAERLHLQKLYAIGYKRTLGMLQHLLADTMTVELG